MKKFIFGVAIIFCSTLELFGQNFTVSIERNNFLYLGIQNLISVVVENRKCQEVLIETDNGKLFKLDDCRYYIIPERLGKATLFIRIKKNNEIIEIGRYNYKVIQIQPSAVIESDSNVISSDSSYLTTGHLILDKQTLLTATKLSIVLFNMNLCEIDKRVKSFGVLTIRKDGVSNYLTSSDDMITETIIKEFSKLKKGDKVYFLNIKCGFSGIIQELEPICIEIK